MEEIMSSKVLSALGLVLFLGCQSETPQVSEQNQTSASFQALSARDDAALAQCGRAVDNCNNNRPDAAPGDQCQRLADHCAELQAHLAEVRKPAADCLESADPATCEPLNDGAVEDGKTVIDCSTRVAACLTRVAELPEPAAISCDNISAACERVAALAAEAGEARARGDENASDIAKEARDKVDELDDAEEDLDEDGDLDEDEDLDEDDLDEGDEGDDALPDAGAPRGPRVRPDRTEG
jgi:hypothetical protein